MNPVYFLVITVKTILRSIYVLEPLTVAELDAASAEVLDPSSDEIEVGISPVQRLNVYGIPLDTTRPRFFGVPRDLSLCIDPQQDGDVSQSWINIRSGADALYRVTEVLA